MIKLVLKICLSVCLLFFFFEIACRVIKPQNILPHRYDFRCTLYINDSSEIQPIQKKNVILKIENKELGFDFTATYNSRGSRITHNNLKRYDILDKIIITGCSFAHGDEVDDQYSYPFVLQSKINNYEIINEARGGYGAGLAYEQIKRDINLMGDKLTVIIYNYASFHNYRSVNNLFRNNSMRNNHAYINEYKNNIFIKKYFKNDYCFYDFLLKEENLVGKISCVDFHYSILENLYVYNLIKNISIRVNYLLKNEEMRSTTFALIREMNSICKQHNILYIVVPLTKEDKESKYMEEMCKTENIPYIYSGVDAFDAKMITRQGGHYSIKGNEVIADSIYNILSKYIDF